MFVLQRFVSIRRGSYVTNTYLPKNRTSGGPILTPPDVEFDEMGEKDGNVIEDALVLAYGQIPE